MSTIKTDNISDRVGTKSIPTLTVINGSAKAWVNFNGTGTINAGSIRAAFNVATITDNGVGDYTVNFTTPMPDVNYAFVWSAGVATPGSASFSGGCSTKTVNSVRHTIQNSTSAAQQDAEFIYVAIFR